MAAAITRTGLQEAGYTYIGIDDCWQAEERAADGSLQPHPIRFPRGIRALSDDLHSCGAAPSNHAKARARLLGPYCEPPWVPTPLPCRTQALHLGITPTTASERARLQELYATSRERRRSRRGGRLPNSIGARRRSIRIDTLRATIDRWARRFERRCGAAAQAPATLRVRRNAAMPARTHRQRCDRPCTFFHRRHGRPMIYSLQLGAGGRGRGPDGGGRRRSRSSGGRRPTSSRVQPRLRHPRRTHASRPSPARVRTTTLTCWRSAWTAICSTCPASASALTEAEASLHSPCGRCSRRRSSSARIRSAPRQVVATGQPGGDRHSQDARGARATRVVDRHVGRSSRCRSCPPPSGATHACFGGA